MGMRGRWARVGRVALGPPEGALAPPPRNVIASVVSVPVLSNKQCVTLPARGTRKGSVQKTLALKSAMSAVLTASAVCIGSSGGTTEVRIRTHRSKSCKKEDFKVRYGKNGL